jgi:hypothetical protein
VDVGGKKNPTIINNEGPGKNPRNKDRLIKKKIESFLLWKKSFSGDGRHAAVMGTYS